MSLPPPPLDCEEPEFFSFLSRSAPHTQRPNIPPETGLVSLACWQLTLSDKRFDELLPLLNPEEQARAAKFAKRRLAASFIAARTGLRAWIAHFLGCLPQEIEFKYGPKGKPSLVGQAENQLEFNLAHSGGLALLAITKEPVGVDLERHRQLRSAEGMAGRWYSESERERIQSQAEPDQLAEFFHIWALKESILKLVGSGVGESLPKLETPADPTGGTTAPPETNIMGMKKCWAQRIEVADAHSAALAMERKPKKIEWLGLEVGEE